ncbi:TPA: DUF1642 domain-containing protein [Enterococcus faecalis]|nr:DUF1642 domain-containing protein [Enterococcus faecalis]
MNKQEKEDLIQALYDIGGCDAEDEWSRGYDDGVNAAIEVIKELKVQGKVIFSHEEKFVADWLDGLRGQISNVKLNSGAVFMTFIGRQLERYYDEEYSFLTEKIESWLTVPKNKVKLMSAIDNGYEVEKEQLYKVVIDHKYLVQLFSGRTDARLVEYEELTNWHDSAYKLTEQEIKAIDERYWPFAVKVDGE